MIIALKCLFLALAITYGVSNIAKIIICIRFGTGRVSSFQMWLMSIGIVGFILLHVFLGL